MTAYKPIHNHPTQPGFREFQDGDTLSVPGLELSSLTSGSESNTVTAAIQTTTDDFTTLFSTTLNDDSHYWFEANVVARDTTTTSGAFYKVAARSHRTTAGSVVVDNVYTLIEDEDEVAFDCIWSSLNNDMTLVVVGQDSRTINWTTTVQYQGVSGNS